MQIANISMTQKHSFMLVAAAILDAIHEQEFEDAQRWFDELHDYWTSYTTDTHEFAAREALLAGIENMLTICA